MSVKNKKNSSNTIIINKSELPLSCPRENYLKLSHPKIFLPIEKETNKTIKCPYCSTIYELDEDGDL
jgi:uncharacterized Zn-finger protein|tara:strand:- start:3257 stop:3457 length:201 start_codon:yes stop_codon:yes gene_type:complete